MSSPQKQIPALIGLFGGAVILVFLDLNLSLYADPDSLAEGLRKAFRTAPYISWIVGVLLGHFYHPFGEAPFRENLPWPLNRIVDPLGSLAMIRILVAVVGSTAIIFLMDLLLNAVHLGPFPVWIFLLAGMVFGAFMWPTSFARD